MIARMRSITCKDRHNIHLSALSWFIVVKTESETIMLNMPYYTYLSEHMVSIKLSTYKGESHNLRILLYLDDQPYCSLTVNLNESILPFQAFIDTYNLDWVVDFITDNRLGYYAGKTRKLKRCEYPLFCFYPERLYECSPFDFDIYAKEISRGVNNEHTTD